jgi:hypothetical protein
MQFYKTIAAIALLAFAKVNATEMNDKEEGITMVSSSDSIVLYFAVAYDMIPLPYVTVYLYVLILLLNTP